MLVHLRDASTLETHDLEFQGALVLALEPPLTLHDRAHWELAPDAVEGTKRVYDVGRLLTGTEKPTVRVGQHVVLELILREDELGWHVSMNGLSGVKDVPLPDFDPQGSTGLGVTATLLH